MLTRYLKPAALLFLALSAISANSGPVLDDILNYMYVDQGTPMNDHSLSFTIDRTITLTQSQPIGQTFVAGLNTDRIARVRAYLEPNSNWQPGEGAEMVIWDSPEKHTVLGRYTIDYTFRGYVFCVAEFEVNALVVPGNTYYLEISYVGAGDGILCPIGVMNGQYNYDIMQKVIYVNQSAPAGGDGQSWATAFNTIQAAVDAIGSIPSGQGYLNGAVADFDMCFQVHARKKMDRLGNLKKVFARFALDRPELAAIKKAVKHEDFETAIAKTVNHFETRTNLPAIINAATVPVPNPSFDRTGGDMALQNSFWGDTCYGYVGPDINWRPQVVFDSSGHIAASGFTMNRYGPRGVLANAYLGTGEDKYAKKLNDVLVDWFKDNPPPQQSKIGGASNDDVWASLNTGIRIAHGFIAYDRIHASPQFTTDCRFAYIIDLADHADTLLWNGTSGGNWGMTQNSALVEFALNYPEFTNSQQWFDTACVRLDNSIRGDILSDGTETESAPGYQRWMYYNPLMSVYQFFLARGVSTSFTAGLRDLLEKQAEYFMYMAMPNGTTPELGDWGDGAPGILVSDSQVFNRPDMLYVGTNGAQGTAPTTTSKCYPGSGIVTMRSDWGNVGQPYTDSRYMLCHGVHCGGHGHPDLNGVTVYAYGRDLLLDAGSYIYGSPEYNLLVNSISHNLMTVDGMSQNSFGDTPFRQWSTTPIADYLSSSIPAYSTGNYHREILYVKSNGDGAKDYWIVHDKAEGSGTHSLEQRWHLAPGTLTVDGPTLTASTGFTDGGGNLAIVQTDPSRLQAQQTTIDCWLPRGSMGPPVQLPTVIYKVNAAALPAAIDTILLPYKGAQAPAYTFSSIQTSSDGLDSVFKLTQGNVQDVFAFQRTAQPKTIASENITFDGERVFVRKVNGVLRSVVLINGKQLSVNGTQIVNTTDRQPWYAASF